MPVSLWAELENQFSSTVWNFRGTPQILIIPSSVTFQILLSTSAPVHVVNMDRPQSAGRQWSSFVLARLSWFKSLCYYLYPETNQGCHSPWTLNVLRLLINFPLLFYVPGGTVTQGAGLRWVKSVPATPKRLLRPPPPLKYIGLRVPVTKSRPTGFV